MTHELLFLRDHIMENLPGKLDMFLDTARKKSLETEGKTLKDQLQIRMACPFLEDGDCSVYSARPMACRIYLSSSVSACRKEHDNPGDEKEFPGLFEFPLQAGRMLNEGFVAYLKHNGLSSAEVPIEQGFASMVTHGQSFRTWLK